VRFIKYLLQVDLFLLSLAASVLLNNAVEDPLHGLRPGRAADLAWMRPLQTQIKGIMLVESPQVQKQKKDLDPHLHTGPRC